MQMNKKCPTCGLRLSVNAFHRNSKTSSGLDWRCKSCKKLNENKEKQRERDQRRREVSPIKKKARDKARRYYGGEKYQCHVLSCVLDATALHHIDYLKPLDVIPLCSDHHDMEHRARERFADKLIELMEQCE